MFDQVYGPEGIAAGIALRARISTMRAVPFDLTRCESAARQRAGLGSKPRKRAAMGVCGQAGGGV